MFRAKGLFVGGQLGTYSGRRSFKISNDLASLPDTHGLTLA